MSDIKIGFCFDRSSVVKAFTPLILEALKKNLEVSLFCGPDPKNSWPNNPNYRPLKKNIFLPYNVKNRVSFVYFKNNQHLEKLVKENKISHFFTLHFAPDKFDQALLNLRKQKIKIYCLQWTGDFLNVSPKALKQVDRFFIYSSWFAKIYFKAYSISPENKIRKKFLAYGNPIFDSISDLDSPVKIKKKYGLPADKKIVLLLSLDPFYPWAKWIFTAKSKTRLFLDLLRHRDFKLFKKYCKDINYQQILQKIRLWCEKNNALLVCKTRSRHREPEYLKEICHKVLLEEKDWYPIMSTELISISDLLINFNSAGIWEAAFLKVYSLTLDIPDPPKRSKFLHYRYDPKIYRYKGVGSWIKYKKFPDFLRQHPLGDFKIDLDQQKKYVKKYLEFEKPKAAKRIINHLIANHKSLP